MRKALARIANVIAKFIAVVLTALFVVTAVAALPLFNAGWHLFSAPMYKRALASQDVYARLPVEIALSEAVAAFPDEADMTQVFEGESGETTSPDAGGEQQDPRSTLRLIRLGLRLSPLIPVVLLLLVALFAVRSRKGLLRWWGIPSSRDILP